VVNRFGEGPEHVVVGVSKSVEAVPIGSRWRPDELFVGTHVRRTGRSARIRAEDVTSAGGDVAEFLRRYGYRSQVASPIVVDGRLWGAMSVNTADDLPQDSEDRLASLAVLADQGEHGWDASSGRSAITSGDATSAGAQSIGVKRIGRASSRLANSPPDFAARALPTRLGNAAPRERRGNERPNRLCFAGSSLLRS
jgi:hypothetical protein